MVTFPVITRRARTRINNCNDQTHKSIFRVRLQKPQNEKNAYIHTYIFIIDNQNEFYNVSFEHNTTYLPRTCYFHLAHCVRGAVPQNASSYIRYLYAMQTSIELVGTLYMDFAIRINMRHNIILWIRIVLI